jgi:Na+/proline symporter
MLVLVVGLVVLLFVVLGDVGGWSVISAQLPENTIRFFPTGRSAHEWVDYIHVWMTLGFAGLAANSIIQRALSARSEAVAQNSFLLATVGYIVIGSIPLALGLIASVTMPGIEDSNAILSDIAIEHLHPVLVVIFVGAILSAIMSTSDSILLSVGSIISTNLLPRVVKNPGGVLRLRVARWSIPLTAAASTYIAFGAEKVVEVLVQSIAPLLAMTIVPFVLCFWWNRANPYGALAGIFGGLIGWLVALSIGTSIPPDLIGFGVSLVSMIGVALLTQKVSPPRPLVDFDDKPVELNNRVASFRAPR